MFVFTTFSIFFAHLPNRRVDKEISKSCSDGEIFKINKVREFPPKLDRKIFVSGEFLKGMCFAFLPSIKLESPPPLLAKKITCVKKNKLLLIDFDSFSRKFFSIALLL